MDIDAHLILRADLVKFPGRLRERLDQSNMANAFDRLATRLTLHFDNNAKLPPERVATGRTFLWMPRKDLDNATGAKPSPISYTTGSDRNTDGRTSDWRLESAVRRALNAPGAPHTGAHP